MRTAMLTAAAIVALLALPCPALLRADESVGAERLEEQARRPASDEDLRYWLENMIWHHRFTMAEVRAATGLDEHEITAAQKQFKVFTNNRPKRAPGSPLWVLPYPGGRHPRTGFRDGAVNPQRETKVSIFTPWDDTSYVVADVPEAIWSNLGLTYLAHTHVPTIWTKQNIELEKLEWQRRDDGTLYLERKLPNGIVFSTRVVPDREDTVWFELALTNGTKETLSDLRVQNCVMLARAKGFEQQSNDNKFFSATKTPGSPYVAVHNADQSKWIITAWEPLHRAWANPPCPCLHSDPKFPDCAPGQTRYLRGLVSFHDLGSIDQKLKYFDEMGWRDVTPPEIPERSTRRKLRANERRAGFQIICHRGASEFAHENTLEAYRATFELGADGNEIDIRETKDGVLVCFHDDMLDQILTAYGDVSDYAWGDLWRFRVRQPGQFGEHTRVPTLAEALALHREYAGLLHLDIKQPGLDHKIAQLLDAFDMWDHVISAPAEYGAAIVKDPRYKPLKYKSEVYSDDRDVDPIAIEKAMHLDGTALIVDDPRAAIVAVGRTLGGVSTGPVAPQSIPIRKPYRSAKRRRDLAERAKSDLLAYGVLDSQRDAQRSNESPDGLLVRRAQAFDRFSENGLPSAEAFQLLEQWVRNRTIHNSWRYHALDGASALRALVELKAPNAVDVARECLWRDDPALDEVRDPRFNNPRSWHDWRIKNLVFPLMESIPGNKTERLCRDYLALTPEVANRIGPPQFDAAAKTLLVISPSEKTALELLNDKRPAVRNRAIKECLRSANEPWAVAALRKKAPHALDYIVTNRPEP